MSNGGDKLVFNTRERVISTDNNRAQELIAKNRAFFTARMYNDKYNLDKPGHTSQVTTGGQTPMVADVFGGLFVRIIDSTNLYVTAGCVGVVQIDNPVGLDDDPYKIVNDPGVSTNGVLTWQANPSGGIRIDLIVATVVNQVIETESRDIYNPATGLMTSGSVNKRMAKRLSYSIVRGTPGAGMPTLPAAIVLAVASVPVGTTSWADCTFWDVRPLVQDRVGPSNTKRRFYDFDFYTKLGTQEHHGYIWTEYNGYRAGGKLMNSVPGGDTIFDPGLAAQSTANDVYTALSSGPVNDVGANPVVALFPNGLPRWARYSQGNAPGLSERAPYGPLGILCGARRRNDDHLKCDGFGNVTAMTIPPSTGLVGTANGVLLYMLPVRQNISTGGPTLVDTHGSGRRIEFETDYGTMSTNSRNTHIVTAGTADQTVTFDVTSYITDGKNGFAPNMTRLYFSIVPQTLQLDSGVVSSSTQYKNLMFYAKTTNDEMRANRTWGQLTGLVNGTIVPSVSVSPLLEIPVYHDETGAANLTLEVGIIPVSNTSYGSNGSPWQFASGASIVLVAAGYEV